MSLEVARRVIGVLLTKATVSEKLSPLDTVTGAATSFVLKRYKQDGVIFVGESSDKRMAVTL